MNTTSLSQRRANAIARAESLTSDYSLDGDTLVIASASQVGTLYVVTDAGCTCPAGANGLPCKHAERRTLLLTPLHTEMPAPSIRHDPDGLIALALELMTDEPDMREFEAMNRAGEMLDDLDAYAAAWDADAAAAGNRDAFVLISLVETAS